jgi:hypothetical protein
MQKGLPIIDLYTPTAAHAEYFSDGVHPTDAGYAIVAQIMHDGLLRVPQVTLTAPAAGAMISGALVNLGASASGGTVPITSVQFFRGTTSIGTSTQSPFAATWTNATPGPYSLTAKATDNTGAAATSAAVAITILASGSGGAGGGGAGGGGAGGGGAGGGGTGGRAGTGGGSGGAGAGGRGGTGAAGTGAAGTGAAGTGAAGTGAAGTGAAGTGAAGTGAAGTGAAGTGAAGTGAAGTGGTGTGGTTAAGGAAGDIPLGSSGGCNGCNVGAERASGSLALGLLLMALGLRRSRRHLTAGRSPGRWGWATAPSRRRSR